MDFQKNYERQLRSKYFTMFLSILIVLILINQEFYSYCLKKKQNENYLYAIKRTVEIRFFDELQNIGYATGCVISSNGEILTNKHVVCSSQTNIYEKLQVRFYNQTKYIEATIERVSQEDDLAIIKISIPTPNFFTIERNVRAGDDCFTVGNPNGLGLSYSKGVVSSAKRIIVYEGKEYCAVQTDISINEGNSGGPLLNRDGCLIGIMTFRLRDNKGEILNGLSFAVHSENIYQFLN